MYKLSPGSSCSFSTAASGCGQALLLEVVAASVPVWGADFGPCIPHCVAAVTLSGVSEGHLKEWSCWEDPGVSRQLQRVTWGQALAFRSSHRPGDIPNP